MSIYFEKARELGELILTSDQSLRLTDARAEFDKNPEAQKKLEEYSVFQNNVRQRMGKDDVSREEFAKASEELAAMADELRKDPVVGALIFAENELNELINSILHVFKSTITGESEEESGCGGNCGGCAGCN